MKISTDYCSYCEKLINKKDATVYDGQDQYHSTCFDKQMKEESKSSRIVLTYWYCQNCGNEVMFQGKTKKETINMAINNG